MASPPFIWTVQTNRLAVGSSSTTLNINTPVLPLSLISITLDVTVAAANTTDVFANILAALQTITFSYRGTAIFSASGLDAYRITRALTGIATPLEITSFAGSSRRLITLMLPFGYKVGDPTVCFPKVSKGDSQISLTFKATTTGYSTFVVTVECLQLPGATSKNFLRWTTISDTPAATGNKDYDLPRSAPIVGIGVSQTNSEPASTTADIESLKILAQFQDYGYSLISGNGSRALQYLSQGPGIDAIEMGVLSNTAGSYTQNATTGNQFALNSGLSEFLYMNWDMTRDQTLVLNGQVFNDLKLRVNFNAANPIRIIPVEWWSPTQLTGLPDQTPAS